MASRISAKATFLSASKWFRKRLGEAHQPRCRKAKNISGYAMEKLLTVIHNPVQGEFFFAEAALEQPSVAVDVICPQTQEIISSVRWSLSAAELFCIAPTLFEAWPCSPNSISNSPIPLPKSGLKVSTKPNESSQALRPPGSKSWAAAASSI